VKTPNANASADKISCATCKALCCRLEVRLIDDSDDQVPVEFTEKTKDLYVRMKQAASGWCAALDTKTMLCTIYEKRPFLCREYAVGDFDCLNERKKLPSFQV
jgi:Fe-S-cluster containining protein